MQIFHAAGVVSTKQKLTTTKQMLVIRVPMVMNVSI